MSNKNINESLRDAWQKSLQNGDTIRSIKQKEKAQIDSIVEDKRNNVLSHLTENDKGFYRPESSPYHKFRDGDYLRRQRLIEETEEERKKREAAEKAAADTAATDTAATDTAATDTAATDTAATDTAATDTAATDTAATDTAATDTAAAEPSGRGGGVLGGIGAGIRGAVGRARQAAEKEKQRQRDAGVPDELVGTPSARGAEGDYVPVKLGDEELTAGEQERRRNEIQSIERQKGSGPFGRKRRDGEVDDTSPENIEQNLTTGSGKARINPATGMPAKPGDRWESDDGSTVHMINPDGSERMVGKAKQTELDKAAKELEDRVASGELDPDSAEYRNAKRKAEHAGRVAGDEASGAEDDKRYKDRHNLSPDATKDDVRNHKRHRGAQNKVEDIETKIARQKARLKYAKTSGQKQSIELALINLNRELKRANADVEKYGSAAAGAGKAAATDATDAAATDAAATDTAAAGGEDQETSGTVTTPAAADERGMGTELDAAREKLDQMTGGERAPTEVELQQSGVKDVTQELYSDKETLQDPKTIDYLRDIFVNNRQKIPTGFDVELMRNIQKQLQGGRTPDVATINQALETLHPGRPMGDIIRSEVGQGAEGLQAGKVGTRDEGRADDLNVDAATRKMRQSLLDRMLTRESGSWKEIGQEVERVGGVGNLTPEQWNQVKRGNLEGLKTAFADAEQEQQDREARSAAAGVPSLTQTDSEKLAATTQENRPDVQNPDGPQINPVTPPTTTASAAEQPPTSPPPPASAAEEEEEELAGPPRPVMQASSYNPINKYGINLFEAKGPLQR